MEPKGELAQHLLSLLSDAGLPVLVVATLGTVIAVIQFATSLDESAFASQDRLTQAFASSSRRVRAYALFVISHALATASTLAIANQLLRDATVVQFLGREPGQIIFQLQAGIAAYFLVVDWWSLRKGDQFPAFAAIMAGLAGVGALLAYGIQEVSASDSWAPAVVCVTTAFLWYRLVGWASSSGSDLARAIQN